MRPVVKSLIKEAVERAKFENDILVDYFIKISVFKHLKISNTDLLKGILMIECLWMPRETVLFNHGDAGINFYIVLSGKCQLFIPNPERSAIQ